MIKAILFDFDGVLTIDKTGSTSITNYISQRTKIPLEIVKTNYYRYNKKLLMGDITHEDMWESYCKDVGVNIDYQILLNAFVNTALDENMFVYIKELKRKYYIGMVTDNKADRIEIILKHNNYKEYFDVIAVSAEQHVGKDTEKIFQFVLDNLGVDATECIFIDNTEKNLLIPQKLGMSTILFDDENRNFELFREKMDALLGQ